MPRKREVSAGAESAATTPSARTRAANVSHQMTMPQPVTRGRIPEHVVEAVRTYIQTNSLQPGDRLPPERAFIEQLGVSRSSVREALGVLSALGLIEVRHGDGMYVAAPSDRWDPTAAAIFDATEENALRNLVETRLGIELAAATAAAARASSDDLDQIQQLIDDQARGLETDPTYVWEPLAFELALVEASGNSWLYEVEVMLRDAWRSLSRDIRSSVGRHWEWHNEHRAILASVRSGNAAQVQRLVIAHLALERFEEDLQSRGRRGKRRTTAARTSTERT
jgi:GntR family transcriptional regulator, transcriptional repressor for pyruvate dehydrogenase complex